LVFEEVFVVSSDEESAQITRNSVSKIVSLSTSVLRESVLIIAAGKTSLLNVERYITANITVQVGEGDIDRGSIFGDEEREDLNIVSISAASLNIQSSGVNNRVSERSNSVALSSEGNGQEGE